MNKTLKFTALSVAAGVFLSGCAFAETRDYEGAYLRDPDEVVIFSNADLHPNLARLCIDKVAFITTSRELSAVTRIPEWDEYCTSIDVVNQNTGRSGDSGNDPAVAP